MKILIKATNGKSVISVREDFGNFYVMRDQSPLKKFKSSSMAIHNFKKMLTKKYEIVY